MQQAGQMMACCYLFYHVQAEFSTNRSTITYANEHPAFFPDARVLIYDPEAFISQASAFFISSSSLDVIDHIIGPEIRAQHQRTDDDLHNVNKLHCEVHP